MDAAYADKAEFKEENVKRGGHTDNPGKFSSKGGPGAVVEPAEAKEIVEPFEEPTKVSPGGKKLKEANQPASPEEHEMNLKAAKAKGELAQASAEGEGEAQREHELKVEKVKATGSEEGEDGEEEDGEETDELDVGPPPEKINKAALSPARLKQMSLPAMMAKKVIDPATGEEIKPGARKVGQVGDILAQQAQEWLKEVGYESGRVNSSNATPEIDNALADIITEEATSALKTNKQKSAANWYRQKVEEAVNVFAMKHPEVAKPWSPGRVAFSAALAITSQGEEVGPNANFADKAYEFWSKPENWVYDKEGNHVGNVFNLGDGIGSRNDPAMSANFNKYDELIRTYGDEGTTKFLKGKIKVSKLKEKGFDIPSGFSVEDEVYGSAIFGAKIGNGFFQNLNGNYEPVTQDLWFMRTFGRMTGTLRDVMKTSEGVDAMYDRFKGAMKKETGDQNWGDDMSQDQIDEAALKRFKVAEKDYKEHGPAYKATTAKKKAAKKEGVEYEAGEGDMDQSEGAMSSKRINSYLNKVQESPGGSQDRNWRAGIINKAREKLAKEGHELSNADLQATIWYPEKDLWKHMGSKGPRGGNADYSSAMQSIMRKQGISDDDLRGVLKRDPDKEPEAKPERKPKRAA